MARSFSLVRFIDWPHSNFTDSPMSSFSSPDEDEPEDPDMAVCWKYMIQHWSSFPLFAHMKRFLSAEEVRCSYWYIPF